MIRKVVGVKEPKLRRKSKPVVKVDRKVRQLLTDMEDTLLAQKDPEGVGLAAPQIGVNLRVFLIRYKGIKKIVINPEVLKKTKSMAKPKKTRKEILEGCLSLPHYYGPVRRGQKIKVKYWNEKGGTVTEEFTGFLAQIVQHEIDHLEGVLFIDRILAQKAPLYQFHGDEWEEVEL